jgi:hypothetical protein
VVHRHDHDAGLVVEDRDVQPVGGERQPADHRVDPVLQQRGTHVVPRHVLGAHVGFGMAAAHLAHGGRDGADHVTLLQPVGTGFGPGVDRYAKLAPALADLA